MVRGVWVVVGLVGSLGVAGCSDGGSGDGNDGFPPERRSFEALLTDEDAIIAEREGLTFTDPASLPTNGSATFEGVMALGEGGPGTFDLAADLELVADFSDNDVSATATNFVTSDNQALPGEVTFGEGFIDRDVDSNGGGWTFGADDAKGSITGVSGERFDVVDGDLVGDFIGADGDFAAGFVGLALESAETGEDLVIDGQFDARRD